MKKIGIVVILVVLLLANPNTIKTLTKNESNKALDEIDNFSISKNSQICVYRGNIIELDGETVKFLDEKGKVTQEAELKLNEYTVQSNYFIDILSEGKNYSINENSKIVTIEDLYKDHLIYKSMGENIKCEIYAQGNKNIIDFINGENKVIETIETENKVIGVESVDSNVFILELCTTGKLSSRLTKYNSKGEIEKEVDFDTLSINLQVQGKNIIMALEEEVIIFNENLEEIERIKLDKIEKIEKQGDIVYIEQVNNKNGYMKDGKYNKINEKFEGICFVGDNYIIYSENIIYDENNDELIKFDDTIRSIEAISEETLLVEFENKVITYRYK